MVLFLLLVIAAIVLGILGAVLKGVLFLLFIGVAVFILAFVALGYRIRAGRRRSPIR